jgi:hypothetical protein
LAKMQPGLALFGFCPEGTKQISPGHRPGIGSNVDA